MHGLGPFSREASRFDAAPFESRFEDDDYLRFLESLGDGDALPEEDDDDPDFDADLKKLLDDISDDDRNDFPFFEEDRPEFCQQYRDWTLPQTPSLPPFQSDPSPSAFFDPSPKTGELAALSPARCTRSQYSLNTMDIEDLEGRLFLFDDGVALDEIPELASVQSPPLRRLQSQELDSMPSREAYLSAACKKAKPLQFRRGPHTKRPRYETPHPDFKDIFPYSFFYGGGCTSASSLRCSLLSPASMEVQVNTVNGPIRMQTDAWTPSMILCLNRIINVHTQLLVQSFAACLGAAHLNEAAETMHRQLHSMYQLWQTQSDFDFGFETMLRKDVPSCSFSDRLPASNAQGQRGGQAKRGRSLPKKIRRNGAAVEEVIDLTDEQSHAEFCLPGRQLSSVLDVPLLRVLPHLWQALMVISIAKNGIFFDKGELPLQQMSTKLGCLPSLYIPKDVQSVLQIVQGMMTCGIRKFPEFYEAVTRGDAWSPTEKTLLFSALQLHGENWKLIKTQYMPLRQTSTLQKKARGLNVQFDSDWKAVEAMLIASDRASLTRSITEAEITSVQQEFCHFSRQFRMAHSPDVGSDRVKLVQPGSQNLAVLKLLQGVVKNSTSQLVQQVFGNRQVLSSVKGQNATVMQNLMCLLLGQIGGQLAGSFDSMFTMMSVIAGMQLMNGAEQSGVQDRQADIVEISPQGGGNNDSSRAEGRRRRERRHNA